MSDVVIDASAWLALVHNESGADAVERWIPVAAMSSVNLSEAIAKLTDRSFSEAEIHEALLRVPPEVVPFDELQAWDAGRLRPYTRAQGLSFADRACLALARALDLPVLTGDRAWAALDVGVDIRVFR